MGAENDLRAIGSRDRGLSEIHINDSHAYKQICDTFYEKVGKEIQKVADYIRKQSIELTAGIA
jgi:hypothetical protein